MDYKAQRSVLSQNGIVSKAKQTNKISQNKKPRKGPQNISPARSEGLFLYQSHKMHGEKGTRVVKKLSDGSLMAKHGRRRRCCRNRGPVVMGVKNPEIIDLRYRRSTVRSREAAMTAMIPGAGMPARACPTETSPSLWLPEHSDPRGKTAGQPTQRL